MKCSSACADADVVVLAPDAQPGRAGCSNSRPASRAMPRSPAPRPGAMPAKPRRGRAGRDRNVPPPDLERTAACLRGDAAACIPSCRRRSTMPCACAAARGNARAGWTPQLCLVVRGADRPVAAPVRPGLAQCAVRDRVRRARRRGRPGRRRHGCDRRALAGLACAARQFPDARSAVRDARARRLACACTQDIAIAGAAA